MPSIRQIEKKWINNFQKSPLVQKQSGIYIHDIAYQLFYGRQNENYPSNYPDNFVSLYSSYFELP